MHEQHHIRILLNGTRFTKVAQLRSFTIVGISVFHTTVQLRECQDGNVQFLGQTLQRTTDGAHLFLSTTELGTVGIHQLQVVDHDHLHTLLSYQSSGLRTQLEDTHTRRIININRCTLQLTDIAVETFPLFFVQLTVQDLLTGDLANVRHQTVHQLHVVHFQREETDRILIVNRDILCQ